MLEINNFYILGPGDVIEIMVSPEYPELNQINTINGNGRIIISKLNSIYVSGLTVNELIKLLSDLRLDVKSGLEIEILAEKTRHAQKLLEELIGKIDTEEVLGIIFKNFCIGK